MRGHDGDRRAGQVGHVGHVARLDYEDHHADDNGASKSQNANRGVLATDESDGTFMNSARHLAHRVRAGVPAQDVAGQVAGERNSGQSGDRDDPLNGGGEFHASKGLRDPSVVAGARSSGNHNVREVSP